MNDETSHRVKLLRFPLILLILYIHSFIAPVRVATKLITVDPAPWLMTLAALWSNGVARTAVPLFFLMSGYLYFFGFDGSAAAYLAKTRRRMSSLLVPLLFWNALVIALFVVGQAIPQTAGYFNANNVRIDHATPFALADMLIGITHYPLAYPFWFIRDLIVIVLLTPAIYYMLRWGGPALPLALMACWFCGVPFLAIPSLEGLAFFVIGAWLAQSGRGLFPPETWAPPLLPLYAIALLTEVAMRGSVADVQLHCGAMLIGIAFVLSVTGLVRDGGPLSRALVLLAGASFFVFAAHEPLMTMLRKLIYSTLPASQNTMFIAYAILPPLLAGTLAAVYFLGMRIAPRFVGTISGGR